MLDLPIDLFFDSQEWKKPALVLFSHHHQNLSSFFLCSIPQGGIIKFPPKEDHQVYAQLPLSDEDREKIIDLITTIGTKGKIDLLLNHKSRLEKLGDEIDAKVHPLKFLAVIFSNPQLKSTMASIRGDYFKWSNFLSGFSKKLNFEYKKGKIQKFLNDFSLEVNASSDELRQLFEKKDWEGFLDYLINH
jgi:hypothetical protein